MKKFLSYKSWINEKFTDESDPIKDMGIGIFSHHNFKTEKELLQWIWDVLPVLLGGRIPDNIIYNIRDTGFFRNEHTYHTINQYILKYVTLNDKKYEITWTGNNALHNALIRKGYKISKKRKKYWDQPEFRDKPQYKINESINEKFTDESDPVQDMGIGLMHQIDEFMQKKYPWVKNPSIEQKLYYATGAGEEKFVEYLISKSTLNGKQSSFYYAIRMGYLNMVKLFVANNIMEESNYYDLLSANNPFYVAVRNAKSEILKYLFEKAKKENKIIKQEILDEALFTACRLVYTKSARILLDNGAKIGPKFERSIDRWLRRGIKVKVTNMLKQYNLIK